MEVVDGEEYLAIGTLVHFDHDELRVCKLRAKWFGYSPIPRFHIAGEYPPEAEVQYGWDFEEPRDPPPTPNEDGTILVSCFPGYYCSHSYFLEHGEVL